MARGQQELEQDVRSVIEELRPALQMDGGDVEFVGLDEGVVQVRLVGACGGCPMSTMTLTMGVERAIRQQVPEVKQVVAV